MSLISISLGLKMDDFKISRWVDFVVSELTINELEDFQEKFKQALEKKNSILFEQPLTANPRQFRGMKIEDSDLLTIRTKKLLISRKYRTLEQVAKLSRNQIFSLSEYGLMRKSMCEIIYVLADDKTLISKKLYDSLSFKQNINVLREMLNS